MDQHQTILPPPPTTSEFMVEAYSEFIGSRRWGSLEIAINYARLEPSFYEMKFRLASGEMVRLVKQEPNWLLRLFGAKTAWVLANYEE